MGKIIRGGMKSSHDIREMEPQAEPQVVEPQGDSNQEESWGSYIGRNIAQAPRSIYAAGRSGLGLGDLRDLLERSGAEHVPGTQYVLPTHAKAAEEYNWLAQKLGFNPPEERPEDYWPQTAVAEAPFLAKAIAKGSVKGAVGVGKYALKRLGIIGGASVGSELGGEVGEGLGGKLGKEWGQFVGGLGGGALAGKVVNTIENRPSKTIPKQVDTAERAKFEKEQTKKIVDQTKLYTKEIKELDNKKKTAEQTKLYTKEHENLKKEQQKKIADQTKLYTKEIKELDKQKKQLHQLERKHGKEQTAFEKNKQADIQKRQKELSAYENKIKTNYEKAKPLYEQASKVEPKGKFEAKKIIDITEDINKNFQKAVGTGDVSQLTKIIKDIESTVNRGTTHPKGELSVADAKTLKRNINDQIYERGASSVFKHQAGKAVEELKKFVTKNSSPEHNKLWNNAEKLYVESAKLKKGRKEFVTEKKHEISARKGEKFPIEEKIAQKQEKQHVSTELQRDLKRTHAEYKKFTDTANKELQSDLKRIDAEHKKFIDTASKELQSDLKRTHAEHKKIIDTIGKDTYESVQKSKEKVEDNWKTTTKEHTSKWGAAGSAAILSYYFGGPVSAVLAGLGTKGLQKIGREVKIAKDAFQNHPKIFHKWADLVVEASKKDVPHLLRTINQLGKEIEETENESRRGYGKIISGGMK